MQHGSLQRKPKSFSSRQNTRSCARHEEVYNTMTDNEIYYMYSHGDYIAFQNSIGGRIICGEQNVLWFSPDGRRIGGFYQVGGCQKVVNAYWDKKRPYGEDIVHIETDKGNHIYVSGGSSGLLR